MKEGLMSLVGKKSHGAIFFATVDFVEEQLLKYQMKRGRDKKVASGILRSKIVRETFVFAMYCLNEEDPGLCIGPNHAPVIGTFEDVYDWWVNYGECLEDSYFIKPFFNHSDAMWYQVTGTEKPFCPTTYRGKPKPKKKKVPGKIANHLKKTHEVVLEIIKSHTFRNFTVNELVPTARALLHTKGEHLPPLQVKRKLQALMPRMVERGELFKSKDIRHLYLIP